MNSNDLFPIRFPDPWATAFGEDEYGLWQECTLQGVSFRFRWCEPGTFFMGSPEDEPERSPWEPLHEVTFSAGFWLAEITVTQALWTAVMGENPSHFKGDQRPVEQVSWNDALTFIERINGLVPGLGARLPWEAEWEYACRAGTTTPFSFGENITPEQVNYRGSIPYAGGEKGVFRKETVDVQSLPCNDWGFYAMHGNVWEWCADFWQENLGRDPVIDPQGPKEGGGRVMRGGSWGGSGGGVRSAVRNGRGPSDRSVFLGFRLARGQGAAEQDAEP